MLGRYRENHSGDSGVFRDARRKKGVWTEGAGTRQGNWMDWSHICLYSSVQDSAEENISRTWMYRNYCCLETWKAEFKILGNISVPVRHTKEISFKMSFKIGYFPDFFPLPFEHTNLDLIFQVFSTNVNSKESFIELFIPNWRLSFKQQPHFQYLPLSPLLHHQISWLSDSLLIFQETIHPSPTSNQ